MGILNKKIMFSAEVADRSASLSIRVRTLMLFLVSAAVLAGGAYVWAELATDTYDDVSKIAASWNVSTSTSGQIELEAKSCDPLNWNCGASTTCANDLGDGDYIIVAQENAGTTKAWKTAATQCLSPQCDAATNKLSADNTVDFTAYPARDYCKSIGGRLPTTTELQCIYANKANLGTFGTGYYWSASETAETNAYYVNFSSGSAGSPNKTLAYSVRCVRGW